MQPIAEKVARLGEGLGRSCARIAAPWQRCSENGTHDFAAPAKAVACFHDLNGDGGGPDATGQAALLAVGPFNALRLGREEVELWGHSQLRIARARSRTSRPCFARIR